jgi:two-component system, LytTR family, response regulator
MKPLRTVITDDEPLARARMRRLLASHDNVQIVAECQSAQELHAALAGSGADLLFLDVDMPDDNGFAVLAMQQQPLPSVVFVTAYAEFAVRAFDIDAADYLLKPVSPERLLLALQRVQRQRGETAHSAEAAPARGGYARHFAVPLGRRTHLIPADAIDCVLAQANYVELIAAQRRYLLRESLNRFGTRLDPAQFLRIHRSCIVRVAAISEVEALPSGRCQVHLRNGVTAQCGRSYREQLRRALGLAAGV